MRILLLCSLLATALTFPVQTPTIPERFAQFWGLALERSLGIVFPIRGLEKEGFKNPPIYNVPWRFVRLLPPVVVANTSGSLEPIGTHNGTSVGLRIIPAEDLITICPAVDVPGYEFYQSCPAIELTVRAWFLITERHGYRLVVSQVDFVDRGYPIDTRYINCKTHGINGGTGCKGVVAPEPSNKDWDLDPNGHEDEEAVWKRLVDLLKMGDKWPGTNYGPEFPYDKWGNKKLSPGSNLGENEKKKKKKAAKGKKKAGKNKEKADKKKQKAEDKLKKADKNYKKAKDEQKEAAEQQKEAQDELRDFEYNKGDDTKDD